VPVAELDQTGSPDPVRMGTSSGDARPVAPDDADDLGAPGAGGATFTTGDEAGSTGVAADAGRSPDGRRPSRWDRPPPPRDWRYWVGGVGKTLIVTGFLLLGFVAYQLWGTGIETARAQRALEQDFEDMLAAAPPVTAPITIKEPTTEPAVAPTVTTPATEAGSAETTEPTVTGSTVTGSTLAGAETNDGPETVETTAPGAGAGQVGGPNAGVDGGVSAVPLAAQNLPVLTHGDAIAKLQIPAIGVDDIVVAGVQPDDLKKGPGHYPDTPLPGQLGNSAIAGHRTTYGQPFYDIDQLQPGDDIVVTTLNGQYIYVVTGTQIVGPDDYHVVTTTDRTVATLTLTSCHPRWTARQRIVVSALLDTDRSSPVGEALIGYGAGDQQDQSATEQTLPAESVATEPVTTEASAGNIAEPVPTTAPPAVVETSQTQIADAFADGWFSDRGAFLQVVLWGAVLIAIWALAYLLSRRVRRYWVGIAAAAIPFVVALYFFYQNVNRLLPPNL
jgi:sortase A